MTIRRLTRGVTSTIYVAGAGLVYRSPMGELRLYAIGVDEIRDLFGASPAVAQRFREAVAGAFPAPEKRSPGMLGKLGPLFKRPPDAPVVRPDRPTEDDVAALLAGRFVSPDRLPAAWAALRAWLESSAWAEHRVSLSEAGFNDLEFDLARAALPPQYGLTKAVANELGIPLRPAPGMIAGYVKYNHVDAASYAWWQALDQLSPEHRQLAEAYLAFLEKFPEYAEAALHEGRPVPDLVGIYRRDVTSATSP